MCIASFPKERRKEGMKGEREGEGGSGDGINEKLKFQQSLLSSPLLRTDPSYVLHDMNSGLSEQQQEDLF